MEFPNLKLQHAIIDRFATEGIFARTLKINKRCVAKVIWGRRRLSIKQKNKWAKKLGVKPEEVFPMI